MAAPIQRARRERSLLLRARVALPVSQRPISDAGIEIRGSRIAAVGRWRDLAHGHSGSRLDLGDALILPGLINAHCHLDYTHMAGLFDPPRHFTDWIKQITVTKQIWSDDEFRASWLGGADMLVRTGTTTVADIEAVPSLLPGMWQRTPLRVFSFLEMTGIRSRRDPVAILNEALARIGHLPRGRCRARLSPHAPYSTKPELMARTAEVSRQRRWVMTTHVAESATEYEMFARGRGEMFQWLKRNERDMSDCGRGSPVKQLHRGGVLGPHLLAIHLNYLGRGDAQLLAETGTHVAHCPHSHAYFKHHAFACRPLHKAGVNLCLGTDSLASTHQSRGKLVELSLFAEMNEFAACHPNFAPPGILRMVTVNGARALGCAGQLGELSAGAAADLVAIPFTGRTREAAAAAVHFGGHVSASLIGGRWAIEPPGHGT